MIPVDEPFKAACDKCDALREQLRTKAEVPVDLVPDFGAYVALARKLTENLDLSQIGVLISYGKTVLADLDFDVCCLGFNVIVGLLKGASNLQIRAASAVTPLAHAIKYSRTICDEILRVYREPFAPVLTRETINNLSAHITAAFSYTMALLAMFKPDYDKTAGYATLAAAHFSKLVPPQTSLVTFFRIYADAQYARGRPYPDEIGIAVSYGQNAVAQYGALGKQKLDPGVASALQSLMGPFAKEVETLREKTWKVFQKVVPSYTAPPAGKSAPCPTADIWAVPDGARSLDELVGAKALERIDAAVREVQAAAEPAIAQADAELARVPAGVIRELEGVVASLHAQRTATRELADEVSRTVGAQPRLLGRFPQLGQRLQQLQTALNSAANTDLTYETQYGQATSTIDVMERIAREIEGGKARLVGAREAFMALAEEVRGGKRDREGDMKAAEIEAKRAIQDVQAAVARIQGEFETKLQYYMSLTQGVKTGFASAIAFYEKAERGFQDIKTRISGLG